MSNTPDQTPSSTEPAGSDHPWQRWLEATQGVVRVEASSPDDISRRTMLIILLVFATLGALLYPFYDYQVQRELLERDLQEAQEEFQADLEQELANARSASRARARQSETDAREARIRAVRVTGVMDGISPVVVVDLGSASHDEAARTICSQAEAYLKRPLRGTTLGIQRARGNRPSLDVGTVVCN